MTDPFIGCRFSRLVVLSFAGRTNHKHPTYECACDCGAIVNALRYQLKSGRTKSCGCLKKERCSQLGKIQATHHHASNGVISPEYRVWSAMKSRCRHHPRYHGRGITVCERWQKFENFLADMGPRPSLRHTLDRHPDNNGNYEPGNCRWATAREQNNNRRDNRPLTFQGETMNMSQWAQRLGLKPDLIHYRLKIGWSVERALTAPLRRIL